MRLSTKIFRSMPRALQRATIAAISQDDEEAHPVLDRWPGTLSYDQPLLNEWKAARFRNYVREEVYKSVPVGGPALLCLLADGFPAPASILDFGGSFGEAGLVVSHHGKVGSYTVVETEGVASEAARIERPHPIQFTSGLAASRSDIVYTSGVIQYLPDWETIVASLMKLAGTYAVFCRNSFSETSIIRMQVSALSGHGAGSVPEGTDGSALVRSPHQTISRARLIQIAEDAGLHLYAEFEDSGGAVPYRGLVTGGSLVFRRSSASSP